MSKLNPSCISDAYNKYYSNGFYTARYPNSNPNVVDNILNHLSSHSENYKVLDYGCGNGRYLDLLLKKTNADVYGFDISQVAIEQARKKLKDYENRTALFCITDELDSALANENKMDLVLLLFGVLSHIDSKTSRKELLERLFAKLKKDSGVFILSVPNKRRRFLSKQFLHYFSTQGLHLGLKKCLRRFFNNLSQQERQSFSHDASENSDINYSRFYEGEKINLSYHLYTTRELTKELNEVGFTIEKIAPESIFPEKYILKYSWLANADRALCSMLPAWMGYGILAVVRRNK